jgi:hypothetical protein
MTYTVETVIQVWDDSTGERIEVGPDRDGLELIEIRYVTDDGKISSGITMTPEQALLVADAVKKLCGVKE